MHHHTMLSREKNTSRALSGQSGLQLGVRPSRRRSVRRHRRGKYNAKGVSSPADGRDVTTYDTLHKQKRGANTIK